MGNSLQSNKVRPVDNDLLELEAAYAERSKWSRWCLPSLVQKEVPKRHQLQKRKRKRPSTNAETGSPPVRPKEGRQSKTIGRMLSTLSFCLCFGVSVKTSNEVGPSAAAEAEECPSRGSAEGASHTACISRCSQNETLAGDYFSMASSDISIDEYSSESEFEDTEVANYAVSHMSDFNSSSSKEPITKCRYKPFIGDKTPLPPIVPPGGISSPEPIKEVFPKPTSFNIGFEGCNTGLGKPPLPPRRLAKLTHKPKVSLDALEHKMTQAQENRNKYMKERVKSARRRTNPTVSKDILEKMEEERRRQLKEKLERKMSTAEANKSIQTENRAKTANKAKRRRSTVRFNLAEEDERTRSRLGMVIKEKQEAAETRKKQLFEKVKNEKRIKELRRPSSRMEDNTKVRVMRDRLEDKLFAAENRRLNMQRQIKKKISLSNERRNKVRERRMNGMLAVDSCYGEGLEIETYNHSDSEESFSWGDPVSESRIDEHVEEGKQEEVIRQFENLGPKVEEAFIDDGFFD